jgi:hypothetical protein
LNLEKLVSFYNFIGNLITMVKRLALFSVTDKTGIVELGKVISKTHEILASG